MRVKPKIKLEILTKRWVLAILVTTYACILFALVFGIFEPSLRYTLSTRSGDICSSEDLDTTTTPTTPTTTMTTTTTTVTHGEASVTWNTVPQAGWTSQATDWLALQLGWVQPTPARSHDTSTGTRRNDLQQQQQQQQQQHPPGPAGPGKEEAARYSGGVAGYVHRGAPIPSPTSACTTVEPDGTAIWNGYITGYHRLNGIFSAVAQLSNSTAFHYTNSSDIYIDVMVWGRDGPSENDWVLLRNFTAVKTPIYCLQGRTSCDDVVILSEWNTQCLTCALSFQKTIYPEYRLRVTFPPHQTLHTFADQVKYRFVYNSLKFREGEIFYRSFFLLTTLIVLAVWLVSLRHTPWTTWHPEQRWVTFMLCALIMYQNPLFVPMLYMVGQVLQFFATLCNFTAISAMLLFWLLLIDGLRTRNHTWGFYTPKLMYGALLWVSQFCVSLMTLLLSGAKNRDNVKYYDTLSQVASYTMLFLYGLWGILFFYYVWRTARVLRLLPYLSTRFQQLSFRFFIFQAGMVIIFLGFNLIFSFATPSSWHRGMFFATLNGLKSSSADRDSSPNEHSYGAHLLVTIYIYILAFIYLPPNRSIKQGLEPHEKIHTSVPEIGAGYDRLVDEGGGGSSGFDPAEQFSIPTAIWLFDFAWHVYYDPKGYKTESSFGPLDESVGFEVLDFISNEETEICCLVAYQHGKIVVSYRGSASRKNWVYNTKVRRERVDLNERHSLFSWNTIINNIPGKKLVTLPRIHSGFWTAYNSVYEQVNDAVLRAMARASDKTTIYVTGHSLGGALATLAALDFRTQLGLTPVLYNFGSPRVADYNFSFVYNKLVPKTFRVVCDGDVVTGMPKMLLLYKHVGHEVVIDLQGNVIVDPTFVESIFRTSARNRVKAHLMESYRIGLHMAQAALTAEAEGLRAAAGSPLISPLQSPTAADMDTVRSLGSDHDPATLSLPGPAVTVDVGPGVIHTGGAPERTSLHSDSISASACEFTHSEGKADAQPGFDIATSAARAADDTAVSSALHSVSSMLGISDATRQRRHRVRKGKARFKTTH